MNADFKFFEENREKFFREHPNEFVLISSRKAVGFFGTEAAALAEAAKRKLDLGTFIVQRCVLKMEDIQHFHSRVAFG